MFFLKDISRHVKNTTQALVSFWRCGNSSKIHSEVRRHTTKVGIPLTHMIVHSPGFALRNQSDITSRFKERSKALRMDDML
jgi:hypothetical protein